MNLFPGEAVKNRKWYFVAEMGAIPLKEGRRVYFGDHEVALFNLGDGYRAIDNRCPHKQGPLGDGILSGKAVFCPLHNWKINLETGCASAGGVGKVRVYPVRVSQNQIYVAFEEGSYCEPEEEAGQAPVDLDVKDVGG